MHVVVPETFPGSPKAQTIMSTQSGLFAMAI
jgi:hypothetical protein